MKIIFTFISLINYNKDMQHRVNRRWDRLLYVPLKIAPIGISIKLNAYPKVKSVHTLFRHLNVLDARETFPQLYSEIIVDVQLYMM